MKITRNEVIMKKDDERYKRLSVIKRLSSLFGSLPEVIFTPV